VVTRPRPERELARANVALDAANFFLADVRDALGPYLAVYLLIERQWDAASIGLVMSIATIAGILAQTPSGALVDATKAKRGVMVAAAVFVTAASLVVPWLSSFWPVAVSQATAHAAGVVFGPALAAVTLGIDMEPSPSGSDATKASITLVMPSQQLLPVRWLIFGDRESYFTCLH
jgi:sugar phosphate permease